MFDFKRCNHVEDHRYSSSQGGHRASGHGRLLARIMRSIRVSVVTELAGITRSRGD